MARRYSSVASAMPMKPAVMPAKLMPASAAPTLPMFFTALPKPLRTVRENFITSSEHFAIANFCSLVIFPAFSILLVNLSWSFRRILTFFVAKVQRLPHVVQFQFPRHPEKSQLSGPQLDQLPQGVAPVYVVGDGG